MTRNLRDLVARTAVAAFVAALLVTLVAPAAALGQTEPQEVVGEYAVSITPDDVPTDLAAGSTLIGPWILSFHEDGTFEFTRQDIGPLVTGTYEVDGDQLTITDEAGLLTCSVVRSSADPNVASETAVYGVAFQNDRLVLEPVEETCEARALLLGTRPLGAFVACLTEPLALDGEEAAPEETEASLLGDLAKELQANQAAPATDGAQIAEAEAAIDDLLSQLTACWATGNPLQVLPLFGQADLAELAATTPGGTLRDVAEQLAPLQATPLTWERAGAVNMVAPDRAEAVVVLRFGIEEDLQRFQFVLEDGAWRLTNFLTGEPTPATAPTEAPAEE